MSNTRNKARPKGFWPRVHNFCVNNQKVVVAAIVLGVIASLIEIWNCFNSISENRGNYDKQRPRYKLEDLKNIVSSRTNPYSFSQQPIEFEWQTGPASFSLFRNAKAVFQDLTHPSPPFKLKHLDPDVYELKANFRDGSFNLWFEVVKAP